MASTVTNTIWPDFCTEGSDEKILPFLSFFLAVALIVCVVIQVNDVIIDKSCNRYYMLEAELAQKSESYAVQIYGSCHAYTSFDSMQLINDHGISAYNMSNPGEIIPVTYLRMLERFKTDTPKVAIVETWGVNPYETYDTPGNILGSYLSSNIELLPLSKEKIEVINDFDALDMLNENFPLAKYKNRLLDFSLTEVDLRYSFTQANDIYNANHQYDFIYKEMENRFANNGFKSTESLALTDYTEQQATIAPGDSLEIEPVIMKYVDKIIALCQEYEVELIFYRTPYRSTENELRKVNYLQPYLEEKGVLFFDLEQELTLDYSKDFNDYEHLSTVGATKATAFLMEHILQYF